MATKISTEDSEKILAEMTTDEFKNNFSTMLRTRYPLLYVSVKEERRYLRFMEHFCRVNGYECKIWDTYNGLIDLETKEKDGSVTQDLNNEPVAILDHVIAQGKIYVNKKESVADKRNQGVKGIIFVLLDYFRFIEESPDIERRLKAISSLNGIVTCILTGPDYTATDVIENLMPNIDFPYANKNEIKTALYQVVAGVDGKLPGIKKTTKALEEELINAVQGLTLMEAQTAFSKSLVSERKWNLKTILEEKKQIIRKSGILEYYDKTVKMEDVGGLKELIKWIKQRKTCFSKEAEDYGLKKPRGLLTIGMPGCGKSLVCKAISNSWNMPLLRLDFGKLFGSLVGDSEKNAREAIAQAEAIAPAILWIDEIEKAISGGRSSGQTDGGTTSRVISTFLTWMQEKTSPVFVVATANDHESIPPEFLRSGRFDEIFFVNLPNTEERKEILEVHLKKNKLKVKSFDLDAIASSIDKYSGAEIEKCIDCAMLKGFTEKKRKINTKDIIDASKEFVPLAIMREDDFEGIKEWASTRCRDASSEPVEVVNLGTEGHKDLDLT